MPVQKLSVLGSTGSIGTQTLSLVKDLGIELTAISGYSNYKLLEQQALEFRPEYVCAVEEGAYRELKVRLAPTGCKLLFGREGLMEIASRDSSDTLLNSVVGIAGLEPTLAAIEAGKNIALANKETLVTGGSLVTRAVRERGVALLPVDSEHSAIFQCLQGNTHLRPRRIFLTASGGPFFGQGREQLREVTVADALKHPNWSMGRKITVDSATLMNKGLELIEAMWLFSVSPEQVLITVHRQSIVHSMVEYEDMSVIAQLGFPDMRLPIQYALTYPERRPSPCRPLTVEGMSNLTFQLPDRETFRCLPACERAAAIGGLAPTAVNGANEAAVELYLKGEIGFLDIGDIVADALSLPGLEREDFSLGDILALDSEARLRATDFAQKLSGRR